MKRFGWMCMTVIVILSAAILSVSVPAVWAGDGKPSKINVGVPIDLSGPYATIMASYLMGYKDSVKYINENGGVKGVPINLVIMDTGGKVPRAISAFEQIMRTEPRPICFAHQHSTEQEALKERYLQEKMANHSNSGAFGVLSPPSTHFTNMASGYAAAYCRFLEWWKENVWAKKGIKRNPKVALITWDNSFGKAPMTKESLAYIKNELKMDFVGCWYIPFFPTDTTTQLLSAKQAGADLITGWYQVGAFSVLLKDALRLGMKEKIDFANVITGAEYILPALAGKQASEGVYSIGIHPFWNETEHAGIGALKEIFEKNGRDPNKDKLFGYITSLNIFLTIKGVCEAVVDKYGWEGLNSENYLAMLTSGQEFDVMGTTPPVKYEDGCRVLSDIRIGQIQNGELKGITGWLRCPNLWPAEWGWKF